MSPNDNKSYYNTTLSNGIRVQIIHAPNAHNSACSLVVNSGSFDDPNERPGLAHFIEHLLFNGNKKYPEYGLLNDFVIQHSGHINAWTATEHSNYHFDIRTSVFTKALDYFANMFIDPLFSEQAIEKEQAAIHSEYKLKLKDDSRRIQQVHKETCNPQHPFHKFSVGNKHTLADLPQSKVKDELMAFWQQHYQSQYMTLCIVSSLPIEEITHCVSSLFSKITTPNKQQIKPKLTADLYRPQDLATFIAITPIKELHKFNITFALPNIDVFFKSKIISFIAHLIGDESNGSLFDKLKRQGLINALTAGDGISGSNFKDFNISLELTQAGEEDLDLVLTEVFAYIHWLKEQPIPDYLYDEQKQLSNISFEYQEDIKPLNLANNTALNMHHYQSDYYVYGDYCMEGYTNVQWQEIFDYFNANNMRLTLVSQNMQTDRKAYWYETPYYVEALSSEQISQLNNQQPTGQHYHLPTKNPYLIKPIKLEDTDFTSSIPVSLDSHIGWQTWFKQDMSFRVPKGNIYLGLDLPFGVKTKHKQAMMRFYCDLFMDSVSEQHYQAEMAGLHYNLYAHNAGMTLYTSGLSNNQDSLLLTLLNSMLTIEFTKLRFDEVKRQLIKHWRNSESNKPISQLFSLLNSKLLPQIATSDELASELEQVSFEEFERFNTQLFTNLYVEILFYGNWSRSQATDINNAIQLQLANCNKIEELPREIESLSLGQQLSFNKIIKHNDHGALLYVQGNNKTNEVTINNKEKAAFILISQILSPFSFNEFRTKKQLGYLAGSGYMPLCNTPGLVIYIQSHDYNSESLSSNIIECLASFMDELKQMNPLDFEQHKQAVIHQYNEKPNNLNQKSQQLWVSIGNQDYSFDQKEQIAKQIALITQQQLIQVCEQRLTPKNFKGIQLGSLKSTI